MKWESPKMTLQWIALVLTITQGCKISYQQVTRLPVQLNEISGMYVQHKDSIWLHNDSGNSAMLYRINSQGTIWDSLGWNGIQMVDWEDMTYDDKGNIYIADIGNNQLDRSELSIVIYNRIDSALRYITFHYPVSIAFDTTWQSTTFNAEGIIWHNDSLYVFTKHASPPYDYYTHIFAFPDSPGTYRANLRGSISLKNRMVTGAALSKDGQTLALISYRLRKFISIPYLSASIFIIDAFTNDRQEFHIRYRVNIPPLGIGRIFEAIDFINDSTLYVGSERSPIHRPTLNAITLPSQKE